MGKMGFFRFFWAFAHFRGGDAAADVGAQTILYIENNALAQMMGTSRK